MTLSKNEIIRGKKAIIKLFKKGIKIKLNDISIIYLRNDYPYSRILLCPKKNRNLKKAVLRNKIKRQAKEIFKSLKGLFIFNYDIAIVFYSAFKYVKLEEILSFAFKKFN